MEEVPMADVPSPLVRTLRSWYGKFELAVAVFDWAARQTKSPSETTLEALERGAGISRKDAVVAAKELTRIKCAKFIVGRHRQPSRVRWLYDVASIGQV